MNIPFISLKWSFLFLLPCLFVSLSSCGGSPQNINSFSMTSEEFVGTAKQFIFKRAAGYLVIKPTSGGWYFNSVQPDTGNPLESGKAVCQCNLYYSPDDPTHLSDKIMTATAEYQDNKDGTATLTLSGNSNSDSLEVVANIAFTLLALDHVTAQQNEALHAYVTLTFTQEGAGSWSSNGSYSTRSGGVSGEDATFGIISK